jgi:hypothetical protein
MHIWLDKRPEESRRRRRKAAANLPLLLALGIGPALSAGLTGCANPGPPLPPSLKLPAVVAANELTASRIGDAVALHWTTPDRTTDKLQIVGGITAVICRNLPSGTPPAASGRPASAKAPCAAVVRLAVTPGPSAATDPLPAELTTGPPRLLAYRVELLNAAGRSAGPSTPVFAAAGAAPGPVADLRAEATKPGVLLRWRQQAGGRESIELTRTTVEAPATAAPNGGPSPATSASKPPAGWPGAAKGPAESQFRAGATDAGGTLDRSVRIDHTYTYTAQRVRAVQVGAQTLELRSVPSAAVKVEVRDVFPPEVPTGLVVVQGFTGEGEAQKPALDLSWEPDVEPRVAGYRVYRREGDTGAWKRLTTDLVPVPAYRDAAVVPGHIYTYRVTAVSDKGYESAPSTEVAETAPAQ